MTVTELTKWPRLLVVGEPVSPERADEILVRTNQWFMISNDRAWTNVIYRMLNVEVDDIGYPKSEPLKTLERRLGTLDLRHLHNHRVTSAWVGGPHGWVDWDGRVGCSDWNVGKWPSVDDVTEDWLKIATAFPDLELTAQLVPDEGEAELASVTWVITNGVVGTDLTPTAKITESVEIEKIAGRFIRDMRTPGRERGATIERLVSAIDRVTGG